MVKKFSISMSEEKLQELDKYVEKLNKDITGKPITRNWLIGQAIEKMLKEGKND